MYLTLKEETTPLLRVVVSSYVIPRTAYENEMDLRSLSRLSPTFQELVALTVQIHLERWDSVNSQFPFLFLPPSPPSSLSDFLNRYVLFLKAC